MLQVPKEFEKLRGHPITLTDVETKYSIVRMNILNWIKKGWITVITPGYRMTVNEAEVAYCVSIFRQHKQSGTIAPLFDDDGQPYRLRFPDVAEYRRRKQAQA